MDISASLFSFITIPPIALIKYYTFVNDVDCYAINDVVPFCAGMYVQFYTAMDGFG